MSAVTNWLIVKTLLFYLRKFNAKQDLGLKIDKVLDERFGPKKSEKIQDEIVRIMRKIITDLKKDE